MVGGPWRAENGEPVGIDIEKLRREHGDAAKAFLSAM
jgi:8-oxoguanine deaminase